MNIQNEIMRNLGSAPVIPGTGGLRKLRVADERRGKGKRGGHRVIFLDIPEAERVYLLGLYDKDEKEDISQDEKRLLRALTDRLKEEVK